MKEAIRVANCSGFLGDRFAAAEEMVDGGPIDVLTGDYLAELTMAILARQRMRDPAAGYAVQFLAQLEVILERTAARGIKVVANAGGLNPTGLATAVEDLARRLGIRLTVATVLGDDVLARVLDGGAWPHEQSGTTLAARRISPITANAYLGGWGIAAALDRGADVVITGRVSDASLVVGPAAWHHGWDRDDWDALAGAVVAGHVIECGAQATGGNYSFFEEVAGLTRPGYPIAEVAADGSAVITKHPDTGGAVTVGTVTAQLLYEIGGHSYLNPDVTVDLGSIRLHQLDHDRVGISGVRGGPPPATTKVGVIGVEGFRNSVTFLLTGLDIEAKAALVEDALWAAVGGTEQFDRVETTLSVTTPPDPASNDAALSRLTFTVTAADAARVGRGFSDAAVGLALANCPGLTLTAPPGRESPAVVYWPTLIAQAEVKSTVSVDGEQFEVRSTQGAGWVVAPPPFDGAVDAPSRQVAAPIGRIVGARSGDKGGDANLGVWVRSSAAYSWLVGYLSTERLKALVPEAAHLDVERYLLPNLRAVNFVLRGFLGEGVASSTRPDPQAKTLAEYFRAKVVDVPENLLAE